MEEESISPAEQVCEISERVKSNDQQSENFKQYIQEVVYFIISVMDPEYRPCLLSNRLPKLQKAIEHTAEKRPFRREYSFGLYMGLAQDHSLYERACFYKKHKNKKKTIQALKDYFSHQYQPVIDWCIESGYKVDIVVKIGGIFSEPTYEFSFVISW